MGIMYEVIRYYNVPATYMRINVPGYLLVGGQGSVRIKFSYSFYYSGHLDC